MIKPNLRNIITAITLLWVLNRSAFTNGKTSTAGSRENALGGAAKALTYPFAAFHLQAFLTTIQFGTIATYHSQSYRIREFSEKAAALIFSASTANLAITLRQSGIPGYSVNYYRFVFVKSLGKMALAGMQFNHYESIGYTPSFTLIVNTRK